MRTAKSVRLALALPVIGLAILAPPGHLTPTVSGDAGSARPLGQHSSPVSVFLPFVYGEPAAFRPRPIGRFTNDLGRIGSLAISEEYRIAYARQEHRGDHFIVAVDIAKPSAPREVGRIGPISAAVGGLKVLGNRLYAVSGGLSIYDLGDPRSPKLVGHFKDDIGDISVIGTVVYAIARGSSPRPEGSPPAPGDDDDRIISIDVRDPRHPRLLDTIPSRVCGFRHLHAFGHQVFVASNTCGLSIIDASDPAAMRFPEGGYDDFGDFETVYARDGRVYVVEGDGPSVLALDLACMCDCFGFDTLTYPNEFRSEVLGVGELYALGHDLYVSGAFLDDTGAGAEAAPRVLGPVLSGVWIVDVSTRTAPRLKAVLDVRGTVRATHDHVIVGDGDGLWIFERDGEIDR